MNAKVISPSHPRFGQVGEIKQCDRYNSDNLSYNLYHIRFKDSPHWSLLCEDEVEIDPREFETVN